MRDHGVHAIMLVVILELIAVVGGLLIEDHHFLYAFSGLVGFLVYHDFWMISGTHNIQDELLN